VRSNAATALRELGDVRAVEPLSIALSDRCMSVRCCAAKALGQLGDLRAIDLLINALNDSEWQTQKAATLALGELGGKPAVEPLINKLKDWKGNGYVPEHTITALVKLGELAVLPLIEVLLNASVSVWVRKQVVTILGAVGDVRAVKPLIQVLKDEDDRVRAGDRYNWVRAEAALALGQLGDVRAIGPLIEVLKDSDESVRSKAVGPLSNFSHSPVVELFIQMLKDRRWSAEMLPNIARFLGKMGDKRAIDPLIKSLNYSNKLRCGFALDYESRENGRYVPLFAGLKVEEPRLAVVEALNQLTGSSAVELLFNILRQPNHPLRPDAAKALGNLGELSQLRLINALQDEDSFVRQSAAEALGNIGDEHAVPALIEALDDEDDEVRLSAIESLRWIDNKKAVEPLMHQLGDSNWQVREAAIRALSRLRDDRAIKPLTNMLKDENSPVREQAISALGKFEG
jgi:HEAT repeat protein